MQPPISVTETRAAIRIEQAHPGRLRSLVLSFLFAVLLLLLVTVVSWFAYGLGTTGLGAVGWLLGKLTGSYTFWLLVAVLVLLLVLDQRGRLRLDWSARGVRSSWLFGPIEAFVTTREHEDLPPLELRPVGAGASAHWILGWCFTDSKGRSGWLIEAACVDSEAEGEALRQRLQAWKPNPELPAAQPDSDFEATASSVVGFVLGLPRVALLSLCVVVLALAGESLGMQTGLIEPYRPWDTRATADVSRLAWRFEARQRADGEFQVTATLQATAQLRGGLQPERPLALLAAGELNAYGSLEEHLERLVKAGLVPAALNFEVPRDLLQLTRTGSGALDLAGAQTDPRAPSGTLARLAHWSVLTEIDRPGTHLPLLWTAPTLPAATDVVYRARDGVDGPLWLATDIEALRGDLVHFWGFIYIAAFFAFFIGGFIFLEFFPGRWHRRLAILWVAMVASTCYWSLLTPTLAGLVGVDRDLQLRLRHWIDDRVLPEPLALVPLDCAVVAGHWSPQYSRYRELLEQLDLLAPPPQRLPDEASARAALAAHGRARLQAMDGEARLRLLGGLDSQQMAMEGNRFLLDEILAPELCRWSDEPGFGSEARRFHIALRALNCS